MLATLVPVSVNALVTEESLLFVGLLLHAFEVETKADELALLVTNIDGLVSADTVFVTVALPTLVNDTSIDGLAVVLVDRDTEIDGLADELVLGLHV